MRVLHILRNYFRSLFFRAKREADLREELQDYLDREIERLRAAGLPPEAARHEAMRTFGGVEQIKEACRDANGATFFDTLLRDTRIALRRLARDWRFTVAAVLILGLGIGANTASFSVINATLWRGSMAAAPDRLVDIYQNGTNPRGVDANTYPAYLDMAAYRDVFESTTAASVPHPASFQHEGALLSAIVENTTASYPSVLGLQPALGRWFTAAEDTPGAAVVAVLGHQSWIRRFRSDTSIVGRTIQIDGVPVTIVGVGPAGYASTFNTGLVTDFWLPIHAIAAFDRSTRMLDRRPAEAAFFVKARLRDGIAVAQAQAAMNVLGQRLAAEYPKEDPGKGITVYATRDVRVHPQLDAALRGVAMVLLGVVGLVLAVACSNLATLLLVRGAARAKEVSVRLALGATRAQLIRHLLTESLLLSLGGGLAGCLIAWWTISLLGTFELPVIVDLRLDARFLLVAIVLSLATGIAVGLVPTLQATRVDLLPALRDDSDTRSSDRRWFTLKNAFVVFQVTVSVVLLGSTSVFLQMLDASRAQRTGYAIDGVAMIETDARFASRTPTALRGVLDEARRRIAALPGVEAAVLTRGLPMQQSGTSVVIEGAPADSSLPAGSLWAGPGFFDLLRIPLLYGRAIDDRDRAETPKVAVISETMARRYFGVVNAVGRRFRLDRDADQPSHEWYEVIGVSRDTGTADLQADLVDPAPHLFYRAFAQANLPPTAILARTSREAIDLVGSMQRELRAADASLPVVASKTMAQYLEESLAAPKAVATMLGGLGALGLGLAAIGLYAVVAFRVSRRSREIGIRMALGARGPQVVWTVTREVASLVAAGTAMGLGLSVLSIVAFRSLSAPAPGVTLYRPHTDPLALATIALFMALVGITAASLPTWRATRIDPLKALRRD
jgi:putative ABC transport system permease protein